jgi:hypothetical protein
MAGTRGGSATWAGGAAVSQYCSCCARLGSGVATGVGVAASVGTTVGFGVGTTVGVKLGTAVGGTWVAGAGVGGSGVGSAVTGGTVAGGNGVGTTGVGAVQLASRTAKTVIAIARTPDTKLIVQDARRNDAVNSHKRARL